MIKQKNKNLNLILISIIFIITIILLNTEVTESSENKEFIYGEVLMGTKGENLPENITLKLFKIDENNNQIIEVESTNIDTNGKFIFDHNREKYNYRILILGGEYIEYRDILVNEPGYIEIIIYSSSPSLEDISILDYTIMITNIVGRDRNISVLSVAKITNTSDSTWIPDITSPELTGLDLFRFNLPEGYISLSVESQLPEGNIMQINTGFAMTNPIPPGEHSIIMSFEKKYNNNNFNYPLRLPFGANRIKILLPENNGGLTSKYLKKSENVTLNDKIFKVFKGENIIRNSQLNVEFTDLPEPNIQEKTVDFLKSRGYSIVLVIFISIILLLILGLVIFRKKNYISKFSNYQLENIKLIAILDKKYEDNKISSEEYFSNRKKLMDEITNQTDEK